MDIFGTIKSTFDKRIDKDLVDVYTIFNRFSNDLLGTTVYASNSIKDFQNLDRCKKGIVDHINKRGFAVTLENGDTFFFDFVIPSFSVKVEEKVFRPCTLDEFGLHIGDLIKFRRKDNHDFEICTMYMGYRRKNGGVNVLLGNNYYSLQELFEDYEWYDSDSNTWEMFGVEE